MNDSPFSYNHNKVHSLVPASTNTVNIKIDKVTNIRHTKIFIKNNNNNNNSRSLTKTKYRKTRIILQYLAQRMILPSLTIMIRSAN